MQQQSLELLGFLDIFSRSSREKLECRYKLYQENPCVSLWFFLMMYLEKKRLECPEKLLYPHIPRGPLAPAEGTTLIEHVAPDKETFTTLLVEFSGI